MGLPSWTQIVEELFGAGLHTELVRRCSPLFNFLADRRRLVASHIDAVWSSARGKHEAVATVLYQLLAGVVRKLEPGMRSHLATLVRALPFAEWNTHVMMFIRDFAVAATESDRCGGGGNGGRRRGGGVYKAG